MGRDIQKVGAVTDQSPAFVRVAVYARVSTEKDGMIHSLAAQIEAYASKIRDTPGWRYSGVFVDEALSGTKACRPGFQNLMNACRRREVDLILVKSISRFARNTVTLLEAVRELKNLGVDVFFEEQNIHTLSAEGELMLTIMAAFAQEESRSVSENMKWRIRKNFMAGIPWSYTLLGYRREGDHFRVEPTEAETVRRIYSMYLAGYGEERIAKILTREGMQTRLGNSFGRSSLSKILRNEAYTGKLLLQKTYREDYLSKKTVINNGERQKYIVSGAHEAIIDEATFGRVREEIKRRALIYHPVSGSAEFPFQIRCGICGRNLTRKRTRAGYSWICPTFNHKGRKACPSKMVPEKWIREFSSMYDPKRIQSFVSVPGNILRIEFDNGEYTERRWKDRSRSESWTPEMREKARNKAMEVRA